MQSVQYRWEMLRKFFLQSIDGCTHCLCGLVGGRGACYHSGDDSQWRWFGDKRVGDARWGDGSAPDGAARGGRATPCWGPWCTRALKMPSSKTCEYHPYNLNIYLKYSYVRNVVFFACASVCFVTCRVILCTNNSLVCL